MPVLVERHTAALDPVLVAELGRLYTDTPDFASPASAQAVLQDAVAGGDVLYAGLFNGKHIAAALLRGNGATRHLHYLAVHPATRGRGVASRLVAEIRRIEGADGADWIEADFDTTQEGIPEMLLSMGFIPHGPLGHFRAATRD
ncbi:MAG TPA: acetyl-CoA sensor PanZ family protein [Moraxellaceae bacterium]|nr:acetyl-CoA sensor PanZ family protein [Moraxellaceae bacterium]